jgi:hypothetical protein
MPAGPLARFLIVGNGRHQFYSLFNLISLSIFMRRDPRRIKSTAGIKPIPAVRKLFT